MGLSAFRLLPLLLVRSRRACVAGMAVMVLAGGASCDDGEATGAAAQASVPEMQFNVQTSLLGEHQVLPEHGVEITAPAGWAALPEDQLQAAAAAIEQQAAGGGDAATHPTDSTGSRARPVAVFADAPKGYWLIASDVVVASPEAFDADVRRRWPEAKSMAFSSHGLAMRQHLIMLEGLVNWKFLVAAPGGDGAGRWLQVDFILPQAGYTDRHSHLVESSIGSLRPLHALGGR